MIWKNYSYLEGTHAFLSPSRYHWLNYPPEKLVERYKNHKRISLGTKYHALAAQLIKLAVRLPNTSASLNSFVNDAIGFKMDPEILLYYSVNCYGTADAISFNDGILRIHDLKTGTSPASMSQPLIYAGLFCLDYQLKFKELKEVNLRIYQNEETLEYEPDISDVFDIAKKIVESDNIIKEAEKAGVL